MNNITGCHKFWQDNKADARSHGIKKTKQAKISAWANVAQKIKHNNNEEEKEPQTEIQRESVVRRTKIGSYIFGLLIAGLVPQHLI
jgi:hypothetical protein